MDQHASQWTILRSKVGRKVFALFLLSAVIPAGGLSFVTFRALLDYHEETAFERVSSNAKAASMSVMERLSAAERDLVELAGASVQPQTSNVGILSGFVWETANPSGRTEVNVGRGGYLSITATTANRGLKASIAPDSLVASARIYAESQFGSGLCVFTDIGEILICDPLLSSVPSLLDLTRAGRRRGAQIENVNGQEMVLGYSPLLLSTVFDGPKLIVTVGEFRGSLIAATRTFRAGFLWTVMLCFAVVVPLSTMVIRRSLKPLDDLKDVADRVAQQDFRVRAQVFSQDEFAEVADSVNKMIAGLEADRRFLGSLQAIDHMGLTESSSEDMLTEGLAHIGEAIDARAVSVFVPDLDFSAVTVSGWVQKGVARPPVRDVVPTWLPAVWESKDPVSSVEWSSEVLPPTSPTQTSSVCVRIERGDVPIAVVVEGVDASDDTLRQRIQQVVNQMELGLQRVSLLEELAEFNLSTITAFARAIDATSPWTRGHSERVAQVSVAIANEMGIRGDDLQLIHRGGLLHDIGKIAIPKRILDKPGALTDEEFEVMKSHPSVGLRILEPIGAFNTLLPMVESHHERFDGTGYPHGLEGNQIHIWARIMGVADVWDAITSARPYREGMAFEKALSIIQSGSGSHFDPAVVEAFAKIAHYWYQGAESLASV